MTARLKAIFLPSRGMSGWEVGFGLTFLSLWAMIIAYILWATTVNLDVELLHKYGGSLLKGLRITVLLVVLTVTLGFVLAIPVAFARLSKRRWIRAAAYVYVYFFRGTPLLVQVFLAYYGSGQLRPDLQAMGLWWFFREPFNCVALAFTLNTAAYQAEIIRGAIQSVPKGQVEAARSLGLGKFVTFWRIVAPQGLIIALRPLGNEIILMIKGSALASVVTIFDLMGATKLAFSRSYNFDVYLWAALIYLAVVELLRNVITRLDRRLTRHLRMRSD